MKAYGGVDVQIYFFLIVVLVEESSQLHAPAAFQYPVQIQTCVGSATEVRRKRGILPSESE
jgi:hypothetical protein